MWRNRWFFQSPEGEGDGGGGGDGGKPPADPPKGEGSGKPKPEGDKPKATLSADVLPEDLRDRPEAEVKFLLDHMVQALGERNNQVDSLKEQIAELRGAVSVRNEPPKEKDPDDDKPLEELILEDADKAMTKWLEKKGFVSAFDNLSNRVGEAEYAMVAGQIDDFEEYEADVRKLLKDSKLPATRENIYGAYKLAVGEHTIQQRQRGGRKNPGVPPSNPPAPEPKDDTPPLSELEKEVMRAHGITDEAEWVRHRDNPMELKLPT